MKKKAVLLLVRPARRPKWWPKDNDGWVTVDPDGGWHSGIVEDLTFYDDELEPMKDAVVEEFESNVKFRVLDMPEKKPRAAAYAKACPKG